MKSLPIVLSVLVCVCSFEIPLLFGGISVNKDSIGFQRGINIDGNGVDHNTNFGFGSGNFGIDDRLDILKDGTRSGPRSSLKAGKDGLKWGAGIAVTEGPKIQKIQKRNGK
ncbi:hypothetical protein GCK32_001803 [Trichostrongylus colubriformis]|uniref:Uncharacterized protein n=1 Tax=Trichostrongylus colubriformis TaxID=6319 RepID=A0AAN8F0S7_TRICO